MKKFLAILVLLTGAHFAQAQVKTVWATDFEHGGLQPPCSDTTNSRDSIHGKDWGASTSVFYNGSYSDTAQVHINDTLWLTTCAFSTVGDTFVTVEFQQICKTSLFDGGKVEVSNDSGLTWSTLGSNEYINIKGPGGPIWSTIMGYGYFNENSYAHFGNPWKSPFDSIPKNSWWQFEYFDASSFLGGVNASANCMVRFSLVDGSTTPGNENRWGWALDSIRVKSSPCENIRPRGKLANPVINNGSLLYSLGPFNVFAQMWDENSGFSDAWLVYSVNGGTPDSVMMDSILPPSIPNTGTDSVYVGVIPKIYNGVDSFKAGDTVCYWVNIYDRAVPCRNKFHLPADPSDPTRFCNTFYLTNGRQLPYCDDFENVAQSNFWDTTLVSGTLGWELGTPTYGAYSGTRSWTTVLAGNYSQNNEYHVLSPIFDFSNAVTPRISFFHRRDMPTSSSDGDRVRFEYSINGNTWTQLGNIFDNNGKLLNAPQCPTTWYNQVNGWSGRTGTGIWRETFYQLPASFTAQNQVQFRFVFSSDGNLLTDYGYAFDDFCLQNPPPRDASAIDHIRPLLDYLKVAGQVDSVTVRVRNLGTDTLFSIPMTYVIKDTAGNVFYTNTETITYPRTSGAYSGSGLPPLSIDTFQFATNFTIPEGLYEICAYPEITFDADSSNDTTETAGHFGFVVDTLTSYRDHDSLPERWATRAPEKPQCGNPVDPWPTKWELGTPNFNVTTGAYSAPNAWDINLDSAYTDNVDEVLYTNYYDMTNADSAFLSFWHNWNTPSTEDGHWIEYSTDLGFTWFRLTAASQPIGRKINWSNSYPPLAGTFGAGWSGLSDGWEYSQCPVNNATFTGKTRVQFRFRFRSDAANFIDGVSVDDFRIVNPELQEVEMFDFVLPERECVADIAEPVVIIVKNTGKADIDSIPVYYRFRFDQGCTGTWGPWSTVRSDVITDTINPALTYTHTFTDSVNMSVFGCYQFETWVAHPDDPIQENDTILSDIVENVRGCDIDLKVNTGATKPDGELIMQDSITGDTLWLYPLSAIGPNVIQWQADICLPNKGAYRFDITASNTDMVKFFRLRDPFADSTVVTDTLPGTYYFSWECPPLLSAATTRISPYGTARLPIPQDYNIDVRTVNTGSIKLSYVWQTTCVYRLAPLPVRTFPTPLWCFTDSLYNTYPGDPILFPRTRTIDTTWSADPGRYLIKSWTFLPNGNADSATHDDTAYLYFTVLDTVSSLPYCNNFDSPNTYPWAGMTRNSYEPISSFQRGQPSQTLLSAAASPPEAWMTDTLNDYPILDSSAVYGPEFTLDTGFCYNIKFDHMFETENAFDGGTVEFTLDSGKTWITVGGPYNPVDTSYPWSTNNWYNTPYVTGLAGQPHPPGWTYISSNYRLSWRDFKFPDVGQNPVKAVFRFRFGSDASVQREGWVIDNFCLTDTGTCIWYSCTDGIMNGQETGVDCGGPECDPCETCNDGILNQNEVEIDCGGVCAPCPSCEDNVQNGLEEKIDCGGPDCAPCADCEDGIQNEHQVPDGSGGFNYVWEKGIDCGGPCPPCWLGVDDVDPNVLFLGQTIPNPASDITKIRYQVPQAGDVTITVKTTLGREMVRIETTNDPGVHELSVDVSSWSAGVYYYSIEFNGEQLIEKMIVEKN